MSSVVIPEPTPKRGPPLGSTPFAVRSLAPLLPLLLAAGCGDLPAVASCSESVPCPAGSWCTSGSCVANAAPVAVIQAPASVQSHRSSPFGAAGSHDDDVGDRVAGWSWTFAAPDGTTGCEPLPSAGTSADLAVVFPCAGEHVVTLTVVDSLGLASAPATVRFRVEPSLDPPVVATGPDASVGHRCSGTPLTCTPWDGASSELAVSASGAAPGTVQFRYRWTVELPPELAGQPAPRVAFLPGNDVASPTVRIETDGTAIAGRYVLAVEAVDSRGMIAVGRQRVDVGNRPPVVSGGGRVLLPHGFEAATSRFVASGETSPATWSDPDGDPVQPVGFTATRSGDGGNVLDVQGLGDRARITVVVPYTRPADAAWLIGPDVSRRVELVVSDVNGARGSTAWQVEVANRAPRLANAVAAASVDHTYEAPFQRYAAQAALSTWVDDDGDPLAFSVSGAAPCAEVAGRQGTAWVTCGAPFTGRPGPGGLVGSHDLLVAVADPFEAGPAGATRLEIRNRPPRLLAPYAPMPVACRADPVACCSTDPGKGACVQHDVVFPQTTSALAIVVDDDGDPLDLAATATGACLSSAPIPPACSGASCSPLLTMCGAPSACGAFIPMGVLAVTVHDGLAGASGEVQVEGVCPP